jgi:hypothetical protein
MHIRQKDTCHKEAKTVSWFSLILETTHIQSSEITSATKKEHYFLLMHKLKKNMFFLQVDEWNCGV